MKASLRLAAVLIVLVCFLVVFSSCTVQAPESPPYSEVAEGFSAQIAIINLDDTTALTSLFRLSEELGQAQSEGSLYEREWTELQAELMAKFTDWVDTREERLGLGNLPPVPSGNITWPAQDRALLDGADERIKQYRQGDVIILVMDSAGVPVADAVVRMSMLKHDFLFGAGLLAPRSERQSYGDAFASLLNYATLPFYWDFYESVQGQEWYEAALKSMANWASDRGITTKGHPLIWPSNQPIWVSELSAEELDDVLYGRVTRIIEHFRGLVDCWDVVNEPTHVDNFEEPLGSWMQVDTPAAATALALTWARASNQEATLLVNDWRNDDEYHTILEDVIASGARFDAIGLQSHMHTGTWTLERVWETCERFKDLNVPLHFTEVTVLSGDLKTDDDWDSYHPGWDTTPEGEALQSEYVPALYTTLFSHPSVQAITWWNLSDLEAWQGAPAGLLRNDMSPKPAYEQLMRLIHKEWWTNAEATTNEQGEALIRGFYGQYLLTIESGAQTVQKLIHLEAGQSNILEVRLP